MKIFKLSALALAISLVGCGGEIQQVSNVDFSQVTPAFRQHGNRIENVESFDLIATSLRPYAPDQIRQAYDMVPVPTDLTNLTKEQAASLGAGQTIYVLGVYYNPNTANDLATFNARFSLPTCTTKTLTSKDALPLAPADSTCSLVLANATTDGKLTDTVPVFNSTWASESALDVQWAHAMAPLARIVLVSGVNSTLASILGDITLANKMGDGVVSMSLGSPETFVSSNYESYFNKSNMTYVAATGDSGNTVNWPAVSPKVLAVGGTWLNYSNNTRVELAWSNSGGGVSSYIQKPSYQSRVNAKMRSVPDVSFNASPQSGQYVYVTQANDKMGYWFSLYGTSASTPQWAGILAIANANRALVNKPPIGIPNTLLYSVYNTSNSLYATDFYDIMSGTNGKCVTCTASVGYDTVTGLGSPNVNNLLTALSN
jgi:subtilase family serine protease